MVLYVQQPVLHYARANFVALKNRSLFVCASWCRVFHTARGLYLALWPVVHHLAYGIVGHVMFGATAPDFAGTPGMQRVLSFHLFAVIWIAFRNQRVNCDCAAGGRCSAWKVRQGVV